MPEWYQSGNRNAIRVAATSGARRAAKYTVRTDMLSEVKVRTESPIVKSAALSLRAKSRKVLAAIGKAAANRPHNRRSRAKSRYRAQYSGANSQYPKKVLAHNAKRYVRQSKAAYRRRYIIGNNRYGLQTGDIGKPSLTRESRIVRKPN